MTSEQKDPLELDYTPEHARDTSKLASRLSRTLLWLVAGLFVLFVLWGSFFSLDEVVRAQGKVIASKETQILSTLENGIIREIHVKEGEIVEEGQILVSIDKTVADAEYKGASTQYYNLIATEARLLSQLENKEFVVPDEVIKNFPDIAKQELEDYEDRKIQISNQMEIADDLILQKQQSLAEAESQIENGEETLRLSEEELDLVSPLVKQELISKRDVLRLKRDIQQIKGNIETAKIKIPELNAAIEEAKNRKEQIIYDFNVQDTEKLQSLEVQLAQVKAQMTAAGDRLSRTEIRSPMKGTIKDIKVNTVGGTIRAGDDLVEIVPHEDTLIIEAKLSPSDVAFIHAGQKAVFKISTYDYSIYGGVDSTVVNVSPDTLQDRETNPPQTYYRVFLNAKKNHLVHKGKYWPIMPGMVGEVDIVTGDHTVMSFLLKPIIKGVDQAFKER